MDINVTSYPSKNGDCFLINFGSAENDLKYLLVDCGYTDTFKNYLKNDLERIGKNGGIIERLILTHIDADHIQGAISLLKDNIDEKFIEIKDIWHNTYRHLFNQSETNIDKKQEHIVNRIIKRGYPLAANTMKGEKKISAEQATTIGALILKGGFNWNNDFNNKAVCLEQDLKSVVICDDVKITLLSPNKLKLDRLKDLWKNELKKYGVNYENNDIQLYDDAFEMLLSWEKEKPIKRPKKISTDKDQIEELLARPFDEDSTATNGSSIAFVLNIQDKKLLFLADAHPDLIIDSLNKIKSEGLVMFDLIKVSHHGSFSNINADLLGKIDANKYLISTNGGRNNHPHKETIAHIVCRTANFQRQLYFNYETNTSKYFDRDDWKKEYNYSIQYLNQAPYTVAL